MIHNIVVVLTDIGTIMAVLLLLRYVFGTGLALNLKKMLVIGLVYFVYGMICYTFLGNQGAFFGFILFFIIVCMTASTEKRWKIFFYLIPAFLLYTQFGLYIHMYDRLLGQDSEILYQTADIILIVILLAWAFCVERKHISFALHFWECFFLAVWGFFSCFYGDVMDMIARNPGSEWNQRWMQGAWILFVTVLNFCLILTIVLRKRNAYEKQLSRCYQQYFEQEYQAFCKQSERQHELDRLRHDWKNHVHTVQAMWEKGEAEQAVQYVAGLAEESKPKMHTILTGNEVADAIVNLKYEKAKEEGIEFQFQGNLSGLSYLESMDICVLVGNALDNALEACGKNGKESNICMEVTESRGLLLITIENTLHEPIVIRDNRPVTSKAHPAEHGFGVLGMEHVVKKYQGDLRFEIMENRFKVQMILPTIGKEFKEK